MRVTSIADNDAVNSFTWDIMGRLLTTSNAGTTNATPVVLTKSYDSLGRRSGLAATVNSVADFVNTYSYDTASRMTKITQSDGNSSAGDAIKDKRVDLSYDSIGRFTSIARYESLNTTNPIASTAFSYDSAGHLTSLQHTGFTIVSNGSPDPFAIAGYSYTWDAADRLTSMHSVRDGLSTYSYDTTNQLTAADHASQSDESFTYDANGNRTSGSAGVSPANTSTVTTHNRILNDGTSVYEYDAEGNRTSKTDIATGHKVEYSWNHANQLISVVYKTYNNTVTKSVEYQYDALGRRIGKSVDDNGDSTMDRRETFVYDGAGLLADAAGSIHIGGPNGALNQAGWTDQLLFQFTDADADGTSSSPLATRYLYGPAVDQVFAVESASGDPLWALTDHQGTPRDWVQQTTVNGNSSTTIAQHIRYTAFGTVSSVVDSTGALLDARLSPLASYTGQLYDADAGLMYYRARWYDPVLGKFLNDDPMGFGAGDANVSRYVRNEASSRNDATGLQEGMPPYDFYQEYIRYRLNDTGLTNMNEMQVQDMLSMEEPGFDCEDAAEVVSRYMKKHMPKAHISVVIVNWTRPWAEKEAEREKQILEGRAAGHAIIMIEQAKKLYLVNPFRNYVSNGLDPSITLEEYATEHVRAHYKFDPMGAVSVSGIYEGPMPWYGDGRPWFESPSLRNKYEQYLLSQALDPRGVFPPGALLPSSFDDPAYELRMRIAPPLRNCLK